MSVSVVDFGAGYLRSVLNVFALIGEDAGIRQEPEEIFTADRLVLLDVGATGEAIGRLCSKST